MASNIDSALPPAVSKTLTDIAVAEGFIKPRFHVEAGSNAEDGYTGLLYRVTIQDEFESSCCFSSRSGRTDDLVLMVKVPDQKSDNMFMKLVFVSENTMYKSILPAMQEIANMKGTLPWPRCYHSSANGAETFLIFEDLRPEGFVMANRRVALDATHCRLALAQLAKFHGAGMALQHLQPEKFKALTGSLGNPFSSPEMQSMFAQMGQSVGQSMAVVMERYPEGTEVNAKLQQMMQAFASEGMKAMATPPEQAPGIAIVHGDCHINNVMFRYDQTSGAVAACRLIDFQMSRAGATAMDLASLLLPCTEKSMRDEHWDDLLRGYHAELQATLRSAGCKDPDAVYSWDQFMECMQKAAPFGFILAPILLHAQFADKQTAEELRETLHDMGKTDQAQSFNINSSEEFKRRLTDIVQSLDEWNWL